ncbi:Storkhead-box protein 1 [Galemys pyrenaicus]|uniref:Storkhead-box protein 1 n=1 Tax=Galemys pyrenaicus TaxID=202257 RepID=A0A8J6DH75_GALPY|nr:Storkhead-box protein 1 [Galemys pyrenaicus]
MEKFLQIAPHSLAIVLGPAEGTAGESSGAVQPAPPAQPRQLARHHIGYEIFADFKAENMQHFWNKKVTAAVAETFFLGWIDEQVLLIQGKEEHLEALREGWTRRALRPPSGFHIRCLGESRRGGPSRREPSRPVQGEQAPPPRAPGTSAPAREGAWAWGLPGPGSPDAQLSRRPAGASPAARAVRPEGRGRGLAR